DWRLSRKPVDGINDESNKTSPAPLDYFNLTKHKVRRLYDSRTVTVDQIVAMMHVGRSTVYRCLDASDDKNAE
ncbi:hypothetical protein ACJ41I_09830, partial [Bifidobacterium catenulatum]